MNREQAKLLAPIIKAFGDGAVIQIKCVGSWVTLCDCPSFEDGADHYRIKPRTVTIAYVQGDPEATPCLVDMANACQNSGLSFVTVELPE